jgi:hypothetical protein
MGLARECLEFVQELAYPRPSNELHVAGFCGGAERISAYLFAASGPVSLKSKPN